MIAILRGLLLQKNDRRLILDCQYIAYEIEISLKTFMDLPPLSSTLVLYTYQVFKEDSQQLFGFLSEEERALFKWLLKITGIGAKTALIITSIYSWSDINHIISHQEVSKLTQIPGIGKKTAEKLFLEMKNQLSQCELNYLPALNIQSSYYSVKNDVCLALSHLGYNKTEIEKATHNLSSHSIEDMLKEALQNLSA